MSIELDSILNNITYFDDVLEEITLSLFNDLRTISVNYPNINFDQTWLALAKLLGCMDNQFKVNLNLESNIDSLNCEIDVLKHKLGSVKETWRSDLNDSFQQYDQCLLEREVQDNKLTKLTTEIHQIKLKSEQLRIENKSLNEQILALKTDLSKSTLGLNNLKDTNNRLIKCLQNNSNNHASKLKWLDDVTLQHLMDSCVNSLNGRDDVVVIGPSLSHLIKLSDCSTVLAHTQPLGLHTKKFIIICVSDSTEGFVDDSASHWSLLFVDIRNKQAFHFDSYNGFNNKHE